MNQCALYTEDLYYFGHRCLGEQLKLGDVRDQKSLLLKTQPNYSIDPSILNMGWNSRYGMGLASAKVQAVCAVGGRHSSVEPIQSFEDKRHHELPTADLEPLTLLDFDFALHWMLIIHSFFDFTGILSSENLHVWERLLNFERYIRSFRDWLLTEFDFWIW